LWSEIAGQVKEFSGNVLESPADLVTPGLFVDAKFNSTRNFYAMLQKDSEHWPPGIPLKFS
jgi:hypothetical protein